MKLSFFLVLNFITILRLFSANTIKSQSVKQFMIQTMLSFTVVFVFQPHWMLLWLVVLLVFFQLLTFMIDAFIKGPQRFMLRFIALLCFILGLWLLTDRFSQYIQLNHEIATLLNQGTTTPAAENWVYHGFVILWGSLFLINEINQVIIYTISVLKILPKSESNHTDFLAVRRGWTIGVLERLLIFILVVNHQIGAIGFILAAKGIIRFKKMEDKDFAEYVLIGTLLSALLAIVTGFVVLWTIEFLN